MKNLKYLSMGLIGIMATMAFTFKLNPNQNQPKPKPKQSTAKPAAKKPASKAKPNPAVVNAIPDTVTTNSGLRYVITKRNPQGQPVKAGYRVKAHYVGTLTDGKKFDSSRDRNEPFSFIVGQGQVIAGWDEGFSYLRKGEMATLIIPPGLGYGEMDMGDIPANSTLIFEVEVVDFEKPMEYKPYSGAGKDTITLKSGLRYIIISKGDPKLKAKPEQTASVFYAGYLMDGKKFDGNFGGFDPLQLKVVDGRVIRGWQEMLPLMNKGMKVRAIIPPSLGYGSRDMGVIPPNSTLIFDMYLYDLK
ncbi:MAG: FKBP-type peptidyl-prolyl cis-trans isomerase [Bacteroidetes bacterium]|nr:FKBP-type peptidyl-prolyl cis-trans isomerase [Bacteroidota bacterium]